MPKQNSAILAMNRGLLSRFGLARIDLNRTAMSADVMTNWMPRILGSMSIRPGWEYISSTRNNAQAVTVEFIFSADDTAQLELTDSVLRVRINDVLVTRPVVTAAVANGGFDANVTSWTDNDESGATSAWAAGGYLSLIGTGFDAAIRDQQVTVNQVGVAHALRIVIARGPVTLRVGSTSGADDYISEADLGTGTHSLRFVPSGNFFIRLQNRRQAASLVDSVTVESSGTMELPTPWPAAALRLIRSTQSGDVIYVACDGYQQYKIERRAAQSWSIVKYEPEAGPFRIVNIGPVTITPSATSGDITLTASKSLFRSTHVGALFRMTSTGQLVTQSLTAANQFTNPIRVSGVGGQRTFSVILAGTFVATATLQYSVAEPGTWVDVKTWTAPTSESYADDLDNQIIFYRVGIKAGNYTSGTIDASLNFSSGSTTGIARITGFTSELVVNAAVLTALGGTTETSDWSEGAWSTRRGWPSAVALYEGRLSWFGKDRCYLSVSDDFENFDDTVEGDAGPISRSIGEGPVDAINWALPLQRLLLGTEGTEWSIRSSTFDEPLTPTNFNIKAASTQGSAKIAAVKIDTGGIYVQRAGQKLFQLSYDLKSNDYTSQELTLLVPDLNEAGIVQLAVQRQPDTRVHCVRADGTVGVMVFDSGENVICWVEVETSGFVEWVSVLPGTGEDKVEYIVRRTISGSTVRYIEKWPMLPQCNGFPEARLADAHYIYSGAATTTIAGLNHLEGEEVVVWGWNTVAPFINEDETEIGRDFGTFTVSSGQITGLSATVTDACIGLAYSARWRSTKQSFAAAMGTPLNQDKRIASLGFVLLDTHGQGIRYGTDFDHLDDLPQADLPLDGVDPDLNHMFVDYDLNMISVNSEWSTDQRVCLEAASPRPATVLACSVSMTTNG